MNILWVSGWALPTDYVRQIAQSYFKQYNHTVIAPTQRAIDSADLSSYDAVFGYSLGSFLLLQNQDKLEGKKVRLYAPFLTYIAEAGQGGKIKKGQLEYTKRLLEKNPIKTLNKFYQLAGIDHELKELPYSMDDILFGLDQLIYHRVPKPEPSIECIIGKDDSLIDAEEIKSHISSIKIIPNATHNLKSLIAHCEL